MKAILRSVFTLLVLMAAMPVGGGAASQVANNSVTSVLTGAVVEFDSTPDATFVDEYYVFEDLENGGQAETFTIVAPGTAVSISFESGGSTPEYILNEALEEAPGWYSDYVDFLGYESTEESSWLLFRGTYRNNYHDYSYSEAYPFGDGGTTLEVYLYAGGPEETLETIRWVQEHLTIDGEHVYGSTDIPALQAMLNGTSEIEPERVYGFTSEIEDWEDQGLVSDSKWISPIRGVEVEWDTQNLYFPTLRDDSIVTDPEVAGDFLYLYSQNPGGMISMAFHDTSALPAGANFLDFYSEYYTSTKWLSGQNYDEPLHGSVRSETALSVIYTYSGTLGETRVYIRTVWEPTPGVMYVFDVTNHPDLIAETYFHAIESVMIEGMPVETLWTYNELAALFPPSNEVAAESGLAVSDATSPAHDIHIWTPQD